MLQQMMETEEKYERLQEEYDGVKAQLNGPAAGDEDYDHPLLEQIEDLKDSLYDARDWKRKYKESHEDLGTEVDDLNTRLEDARRDLKEAKARNTKAEGMALQPDNTKLLAKNNTLLTEVNGL